MLLVNLPIFKYHGWWLDISYNIKLCNSHRNIKDGLFNLSRIHNEYYIMFPNFLISLRNILYSSCDHLMVINNQNEAFHFIKSVKVMFMNFNVLNNYIGVPTEAQWVKNHTATAQGHCWGMGSIPSLVQWVKGSNIAAAAE